MTRSGRNAFAVAVILLCTVAARAATPVVLLMPTSGDASPDNRGQLDVTLRKAYGEQRAIKLQSREETAEHISTMADFGAICAYDDIVCLQKLGILGSAAQVVVPVAAGKRNLEVSVTIIGVEGGAIKNRVSGTVNPKDLAQVRALVERSLSEAGSLDIVDATPPPPDRTDGVEDPTGPTRIVDHGDGPIDETQMTGLQLAGATVGGIGAGLGLVGLLGALTCEAIFWTGTGPAATRKDVVAPLGSAFWIGTVVGVIAGGAGGAMYLVGSPTEKAQIDDAE